MILPRRLCLISLLILLLERLSISSLGFVFHNGRRESCVRKMSWLVTADKEKSLIRMNDGVYYGGVTEVSGVVPTLIYVGALIATASKFGNNATTTQEKEVVQVVQVPTTEGTAVDVTGLNTARYFNRSYVATPATIVYQTQDTQVDTTYSTSLKKNLKDATLVVPNVTSSSPSPVVVVVDEKLRTVKFNKTWDDTLEDFSNDLKEGIDDTADSLIQSVDIAIENIEGSIRANQEALRPNNTIIELKRNVSDTVQTAQAKMNRLNSPQQPQRVFVSPPPIKPRPIVLPNSVPKADVLVTPQDVTSKPYNEIFKVPEKPKSFFKQAYEDLFLPWRRWSEFQ